MVSVLFSLSVIGGGDSGLARVAFPQDFQRAPNMSLACKVPGDCICFWKSGQADLHQMIPHIVFPDISPHLPPTDPTFIHVHLIPDSAERNDDKLYFFFREKSSEMGQSPVTQSRIGRICLVCTHTHTHTQACLVCSGNAVIGKPWKENSTAVREASPLLCLDVCGAEYECLTNADALESTCVLNLPVYNAWLCLWGCPLTSDPVVFWPLSRQSPNT